MFDCHVHSNFSGDSDMDAETACFSAIEHSLSGIAFVDHLDYDFPGEEFDDIIDFEEYLKLLDCLRAKYGSRLEIIKGIEVGIQPHVIEQSASFVRSHDFDYVLGSVHIVDGLDPYKNPFYEGKTKHQAYARYLENIIHMLDNFADFDMAGHLDYIIRYAPYDDRSLVYADHPDLLDSIFKKLICSGKGFEINTSSYREKGRKLPIPRFDAAILKRYRELGGELVCIGSDSHTPNYLGYKFGYFREMLLDAGFKYTARFEGRKPRFDKL